MENHLNTNKIPTAEEFINENGGFLKYSSAQEFVECQSLMIEFAKLHVEVALEEAYNNSEMRVSENDTNEIPSFTDNYDDGYVTITVSKKSILNAYPLENIK